MVVGDDREDPGAAVTALDVAGEAVDLGNAPGFGPHADTEMNRWSLSEPVKTAYLVQVMDIIEVAIQDESQKFSAINQIRKMLSLNFFNVKSQAEIKD